LIACLDILEKFEHNGIALKTALFPLKDDKYSWDLEWAHGAEWVIREAARRGIYVQVNIFDTWSRERGTSTYALDGAKHVYSDYRKIYPSNAPSISNSFINRRQSQTIPGNPRPCLML
jgi:hypothetical protein